MTEGRSLKLGKKMAGADDGAGDTAPDDVTEQTQCADEAMAVEDGQRSGLAVGHPAGDLRLVESEPAVVRSGAGLRPARAESSGHRQRPDRQEDRQRGSNGRREPPAQSQRQSQAQQEGTRDQGGGAGARRTPGAAR